MQELITTYNPLNDYRLIIDPTPAVKKKIAEAKTLFDEQYKGMVIAGGQPFIYLAEFSDYESNEQATIDQVDRIALGSMPFKLHLKNFGEHEQREIYIGIENLIPLQLLSDQIGAVLSQVPQVRINKIPRVTLAKGLQAFQFIKSWEEYEKKSFSATFIANEMLLLKRMEGFTSWQILKRMTFQNLVMTY
ncbi:2'-5' RNA ligase family protein [Niabella sp. 22666]|uniref:2'-5' RNA ligase family protein n=1 Tax=Niabella sp. 22666 TaxID=3453954 RepID=UPI003F85B2CF